MSRHVSEVRLQDKAARSRLKAREDPYWRVIGEGRHLGYFRGAKRGKWVARIWLSDRYVKERIGYVDDVHTADGVAVLSWDQAVQKATAWFSSIITGEPLSTPGPNRASRRADTQDIPTVKDALTSYVDVRDARASSRAGRSVKSDAWRLFRHVVKHERLANTRLDLLNEGMLSKWRAKVHSAEGSRTRTANDFKAALNAAFIVHRRILPADFPIVVKFGLRRPGNQVDDIAYGVRDNQILGDAVVRRIITAAYEVDADGDLGRLVALLAATGARFSQLARMKVRDVQADFSRLLVPSSRKGKGKVASHARVQVGQDILALLTPVTRGRDPDAALLERWRHVQVTPMTWERNYRGPWTSSAEMTRPWRAVLERVGLAGVVPYALRHSSIVRGIRCGLPIRLVAALHDTSVVMIERHYSRWITEGLDEIAARAVVPLVEDDGRMPRAA